MYIIIGFASFSLCSCIGNRLPHVLLILSVQHLAFTEASTLLCQSTLQSSLPICWKQSTQNILWQPLISTYLSQYHCFFCQWQHRDRVLFLPKKATACNLCLPTTQIQHSTHQGGTGMVYLILGPSNAKFFNDSHHDVWSAKYEKAEVLLLLTKKITFN